MNDVEYLFSLQEKRIIATVKTQDKCARLVERINSNAVPGVSFSKERVRTNDPQNYIEELFIQYQEQLGKLLQYDKHTTMFKRFIEPLENIQISEREAWSTKHKREWVTSCYFTMYGNYYEAGQLSNVTATTAKKHILNACALLSEYYQDTNLITMFHLLFEIPISNEYTENYG